jgi:hypothetical protein
VQPCDVVTVRFWATAALSQIDPQAAAKAAYRGNRVVEGSMEPPTAGFIASHR